MLMIKARVLLAVVVADVVYRLVVTIGGVGSGSPATDLDLFALVGAVATLWVVQLFATRPSLRSGLLTRSLGRRSATPSEILQVVLLSEIAAIAWYVFGIGVYRVVTDQPVDMGRLAGMQLSLLIFTAIAAIVMVPLVTLTDRPRQRDNREQRDQAESTGRE